MRTLFTTAAVAATLLATAQELPQSSSSAKVEQTIGLTQVTVEYARPSARGRKVFGDVVPFGQFWRTGANASTKVTFNGDVIVAGKAVKAGTYALASFPNEDSWTVVLNSESKVNSPDGYDEKKNVASAKLPVKKVDHVETFTIGFDNVVDDKAELVISWGNSSVALPIEAPSLEQGLKNIDAALAAKDVPAHAYHGAARFCLDRNVRTKEALAWAKKAVEMDNSRFWMQHTLALAYAANGDKKQAIATAKVAQEMAAKAGSDAYVKMNKDKIAEWSK